MNRDASKCLGSRIATTVVAAGCVLGTLSLVGCADASKDSADYPYKTIQAAGEMDKDAALLWGIRINHNETFLARAAI